MLRANTLTEKQLSALDELLRDITPDQVIWLSGYLDGKLSGVAQAKPGTSADSSPASTTRLTILYGTETGNSKKIADQLAQEASQKGITPEVFSMYDFNYKKLKDEKNVAIIVSTHGEGDPPDMAEDFHKFITGKRAPKLDTLNYSVLALGDKSYKFFGKTGEDIDTALKGLGANQVAPLQKCDVDFESDAAAWATSFLSQLSPATDSAAPVASEEKSLVEFTRKNPFHASILEKVRITGRDSDKEVYHLEFSLEGSGITYEPGDSVGIYTKNPYSLVDKILSTAAFDPSQNVEVNDETYSIEDAFKHHLEITLVSYDTIKKYYEVTKDVKLKELLDDDEKLDDYLYGHDILDLLEDFPYEWKADELVGILRQLPPRLYSISSSMESVGEEVHATVSVLRYERKNRLRLGACSTHLIDNVETDDTVPVFIDKNPGFKLPAEDKKIIMIGAGTGVAPYRAFLQERESLDVKNGSWLFFGNRHFQSDFLYQLEWQKLLKSKHLEKLDVAFSRDQEEKVYVQHKLLESQSELFNWLENGAHFYICGEMKHMAKDVNKALHDIIQLQGGLTQEKAKEYVKNLKKEKRYQTDVY